MAAGGKEEGRGGQVRSLINSGDKGDKGSEYLHSDDEEHQRRAAESKTSRRQRPHRRLPSGKRPTRNQKGKPGNAGWMRPCLRRGQQRLQQRGNLSGQFRPKPLWQGVGKSRIDSVTKQTTQAPLHDAGSFSCQLPKVSEWPPVGPGRHEVRVALPEYPPFVSHHLSTQPVWFNNLPRGQKG